MGWNKILVSDTGLRYIIPVNIKKFTTRYKQLYECKVCAQAKQLQRSLNAWRNRQSKGNPTYRRVVIPNDMTLHPKPRDAIESMLCVLLFNINSNTNVHFSLTKLIN